MTSAHLRIPACPNLRIFNSWNPILGGQVTSPADFGLASSRLAHLAAATSSFRRSNQRPDSIPKSKAEVTEVFLKNRVQWGRLPNSSTVVRILLWTSVRTSFNINPDCKTSCPGPAAALCHFASSWLRDFGFFPHPRPPAKRGSPVIAEKFGRKAVPLQQDIVSLSDGSSTHQKTNLEIRDSIFARQPPMRKGFEETRPSTRRIAG